MRESETRVALLVATGVAFVAHGWMAARTDLVAFAAPAVIAAACGVALRDYERGAHPSRRRRRRHGRVPRHLPPRDAQPPREGVSTRSRSSGAVFPESFKAALARDLDRRARRLRRDRVPRRWWSATPEREPFATPNYLRVLIALRDAWDGMLALAYFAMVAGASLAGLAVWIGSRQHARWLPTLSSQMRDARPQRVVGHRVRAAHRHLRRLLLVRRVALGLRSRAPALEGARLTRGFEPFEQLGARAEERRPRRLGAEARHGPARRHDASLDEGVGPTALFILAPLMYLQVPALVFAGLFSQGMRSPVALALRASRRASRSSSRSASSATLLRGSRAAFLVVFAATVGGVLCFSYYPALANQLSPKEVFESYQRIHKGSEPLALFGVGGRTAAYYAGGQPLILKDANSAYDWLMGGEPSSRRFLARARRGAAAPEPPVSRAHADGAEPAGARRALEPDHPRRVVARLRREEREPARSDRPRGRRRSRSTSST